LFPGNAITAKQLHQETKAILNQLELGESLVVTRNGRRITRMEPVTTAGSASDWTEIMAEVWRVQKGVKPSARTANPVLEDRRRRR
jgi:antitoxin (DNA-binding transcriptional repressor) of toxin-antitoxin stability system